MAIASGSSESRSTSERWELGSAAIPGRFTASARCPAASVDDVLVDEAAQALRLLLQRATLEVVQLEEPRKLRVHLRQAEVPRDLLADPLVVGDRVRAAGDVEAEQEALERPVEPVERL